MLQSNRTLITDYKFWATTQNALPDPLWHKGFQEQTGASFWATLRSADPISGDLWVIWQLAPDRIALLVGDISGRGTETASLHERFKDAVEQTLLSTQQPNSFLAELNTRLYGKLPKAHYIAALFGIIDFTEHSFSYAGSAWPWPLIGNLATRQIAHGDGSGLPVGLTKFAQYEIRKILLPQHGFLAFYSDGASEFHENTEGQRVNRNTISNLFYDAWSQNQAEPDYSQLFSLPADQKLDDDYMVVICHFDNANSIP